MIAGQKSKGNNGLENLLFPFEYLYCTQGEHDTDYYAMDFSGWGASGKVNKCPLYAPVSIKCVRIGSLASNEPTCVWESLEQVNFVDGTTDYVTIAISHDDNFSSYSVGDIRNQGEVFGHTGTTGEVTGDHIHMIVGKGKYTGYYHTPKGHWTLNNQTHINLCMGVNDTYIIQGLGINWQEFSDTPTPPDPPEPPKEKDDFIVLSLCGALKWSV